MATRMKSASSLARAQDEAWDYDPAELSTVDKIAIKVSQWTQDALNRVSTPQQRDALREKAQAFVYAKPKLLVSLLALVGFWVRTNKLLLQLFLAMNILLAGIPLTIFLVYSISVAVFSIAVGLLLGFAGAVLFTLLCVGIALSITLPIIFFTTLTASFLFLWCLAGYSILRWVSGWRKQSSVDSPDEFSHEANGFHHRQPTSEKRVTNGLIVNGADTNSPVNAIDSDHPDIAKWHEKWTDATGVSG